MTCQCLERCVNRAPQTRREETLIKGVTEGKGTGKRKRRRGKPKEGKPAQQTMQARPGRAAQVKGEDKSDGIKETETPPEEGEGTAGDEPGYNLTPEDLRLQEFYGDWVHANPGTHLDGGIRDDLAWQAWWCDLAVMPSRRYDAPSERVGRRFVGTLGVELHGVQDRLWNSEQFIVFQTVILQRA